MNESKEVFTIEAKREMKREGKYIFKCPPVYSGNWNEDDWITYIDAYSGWLPNKGQEVAK